MRTFVTKWMFKIGFSMVIIGGLFLNIETTFDKSIAAMVLTGSTLVVFGDLVAAVGCAKALYQEIRQRSRVGVLINVAALMVVVIINVACFSDGRRVPSGQRAQAIAIALVGTAIMLGMLWKQEPSVERQRA